MAITGINPVSPRREPQQERKQTWYEKVLMALQAAESGFNIATDIQNWEGNRAKVDLTEKQSEMAALELEREKAQSAGFETPGTLRAGGQALVPKGPDGKPLTFGPDQKPLGREVKFARIVDGKRVEEIANIAPAELINQLAVAPDAQRSEIVKLYQESKNAKNVKAVAEAKEAMDKHRLNMKSHEFVRRLPAEVRNRIGKATNAYVALEDLEKGILRGVPLDQKVGDNVASAAVARFAQFFGRLQSGAVISQGRGIQGMIGLDRGEMEDFRDMLPRPGDTVRAARTKIDKMKEVLETEAISLGQGGRKEFLEFVNTVNRDVKPLAKTPRFTPQVDEAEAVQEKFERIGSVIGAGVRGAGRAIERPVMEGIESGFNAIDEFKNFLMEGIFGPSETQQGTPQPAAPPSPTPPPVEDRAIPPQGAVTSPFQGGGLDTRRQPQQGGLGALTGAKRVITKQGGLGALTSPEKKKESRGLGKVLEAVNKPFVPEGSTLSGRIQLLLDNLVGVDKIGLDPGEKPSKSQPSDADIAFIDSLVAVPGTAKVIKLNPKKRVELLRKRLEKGDLSESEARNLDRISQELSGIKHRQSKVTPKQLRKDNYLDLIRKKKFPVDLHKAVYANQKKNHEIIWDQKPKNGVMGHGIEKDGIGDYFSWPQDKHGLTKDYLRKHGKDIKEIRTKSDLIAHDDYIELLPKNAKIKIHLPPGNRLNSKRIESGAPSIKRRIKAAEKLKKAGFDVSFVRDVLVHPDRKTGLILNDHSWIVAKEDVPRGFKIEENRILLDQDKLDRLKRIVGDNIEVKRVTESDKFKDKLFPKKD